MIGNSRKVQEAIETGVLAIASALPTCRTVCHGFIGHRNVLLLLVVCASLGRRSFSWETARRGRARVRLPVECLKIYSVLTAILRSFKFLSLHKFAIHSVVDRGSTSS